VEAPTGIVTFLLTDMEGSTARWDADPVGMRVALAEHDAVLRDAIESRGGWVFKRTGDGVWAAFSSPRAALDAAVAAQERLTLPVRMGVATGEAELREGDYFGPPLNLASRIATAGHGGQVLVAAATAALAGDSGLQALGDYVLAGLRSPERVFQVGDQVFPPLRSLEARPSNLPAELSGFIGRTGELAETAGALEKSRVVTVTGVGGVGKTRLALRAAAEVLEGYRDGAWLVELAPLADPDALVEVIAAGLGVPVRQGQPLGASVVDFLRAKELLVVLDNCEHLGDAVASWVTAVLGAAPRVRVLATSRSRLGVRGERMVGLAPLGLPSVGATAEEVGGTDAGRLFVERASESRAGFTLTASNAQAIGRLVRLVDGIPLAIELAAARVPSLTPAEIADLFEHTGTGGGYEPLHRAIDWSYELLTYVERVALDRASVFAGDFDLAAGRAVIGADPIGQPEVVDLLGRLVDQSLIVAHDDGDSTRYGLLETIRHYARQKIAASGDLDAAARRYAEHFATVAAAIGEGMRGPDEPAWVARFDVELDNLRAVVAWAIAQFEADLAVRILAPLQLHGTRVDYVSARWAQPVAELPGAGAHPLYPAVLAHTGWAQAISGELQQALETCRRAVAQAEGSALPPMLQCRVRAAHAGTANYLGLNEEAAEACRRWVEHARAGGGDYELAQALNMSAMPALTLGDITGATMMTKESLLIARRVANPTSLCYASMCSAMVHMGTDPGSAIRLLHDGLAAAEVARNQLGTGICLQSLAVAHAHQEEWAEAAVYSARSIQQYHRAGDRHLFRACLPLAAAVLANLGDDEGAAVLSEAADPLPIPNARWRELLGASLEAVRHRLGATEFAAAAARGRAMDDDELATFVGARFDQITDTRECPSEGRDPG
jgi:predicted ATPase